MSQINIIRIPWLRRQRIQSLYVIDPHFGQISYLTETCANTQSVWTRYFPIRLTGKANSEQLCKTPGNAVPLPRVLPSLPTGYYRWNPRTWRYTRRNTRSHEKIIRNLALRTKIKLRFDLWTKRNTEREYVLSSLHGSSSSFLGYIVAEREKRPLH